MATPNSKGVYIGAHNDKRGKSHIDIYDSDPRGPHETIHISIGDDGKGSIVEKDLNGKKTITQIDLKKK